MNNKVGLFIASRRKKLGLTQKELGEKLFVTDKAISKWERGLSFPDTPLLIKLATILEVEVGEILNGEITNNKHQNIDDKINEIKQELLKNNRRKKLKLTILICILLIIITYMFYHNLNLGYKIETIGYERAEKKISLGIPKMSFMVKENDNSFSFKNLRNASILEKELKDYLKTLKYSTCNDTIYYYNEEEDYSIIDYSVKNNFIYSTISYSLVNYDYCLDNKITEYANILNGLMKYHLYGDGTITKKETKDTKLVIQLMDGNWSRNIQKYEFEMGMKVIYYKNVLNYINNKTDSLSYDIIEESYGTYEIKDNKLYYYRDQTIKNSAKVKIPQTSTFEILEDGNLLLIDNYLDNYAQNIVLK